MVITVAYGASRIRDSLVGGATRHLFENMTRHVLFSHRGGEPVVHGTNLARGATR